MEKRTEYYVIRSVLDGKRVDWKKHRCKKPDREQGFKNEEQRKHVQKFIAHHQREDHTLLCSYNSIKAKRGCSILFHIYGVYIIIDAKRTLIPWKKYLIYAFFFYCVLLYFLL